MFPLGPTGPFPFLPLHYALWAYPMCPSHGSGRSGHLASSRGIYSWGDGFEPHKTAVLNSNRLLMLLMDVDRRPDFRCDRPLPWDGPGLILHTPPSPLGGGGSGGFSPSLRCLVWAPPLPSLCAWFAVNVGEVVSWLRLFLPVLSL